MSAYGGKADMATAPRIVHIDLRQINAWTGRLAFTVPERQ
jgi:hypothetical protein